MIIFPLFFDIRVYKPDFFPPQNLGLAQLRAKDFGAKPEDPYFLGGG
jgi:hypothetical protein